MRLIRRHFPNVKPISTQEVEQMQDKDTVVILDSRSDAEFAISHIPGSRHVPLSVKPELIIATLKPHQTVVCACSVGYRSAIYAQALTQAGCTNPVYNMEGSVFKWAAEGRALVDNDGVARRVVHPYSRLFGSMLPRALFAPQWSPVS